MANKYNEKYTREFLTEAVANSISMADVLRNLQISLTGGAHAHISRKITQFGIDTSHFLGQAHMRNRPSARRLAPEEVLVPRAPGSRRPKPRILRLALRECGVPYACEACGIEAQWNGGPIVLHVDHLNGDSLDNRKENLAFSSRTATRRLPHSQVDLQIRRGRSPIGQEAQALDA